MIKILRKNHNTILIFIIPSILILIGFAVYRDYGVSLDEETNRNNSLVWIKYILDFFAPEYSQNIKLLEGVPNVKDYLYDAPYGVIFEVFVTGIIEILFGVKNFHDIFAYRHLANHFLFIISIICFYFLINNLFKSKIYSFFGASILYTTPRIFADSFYNSKDLAFLSFFIFLIFFSIRFLKKKNYYNAFFLSIFLAAATNIRILVIYVELLIILFFFIEMLMKNKIDFKKINILIFFILSNLFFLYIFWPFLWENPINNFAYAFDFFTQFPTELNVFYLGDYYRTVSLPWHYLIVSFVSTTPIIISLLIFCGLGVLALRFILRLFNIDENKSYKDIWRGEKEKIFLFLFFIIFIPIFLVIFFNSALYNSWRHSFFLYPPLILILIYFLNFLVIKFRKMNMSLYIGLVLTFCVLNNTYNLINLHPFQYIYFNSFFEKNANKLFEIDYWGVSNKHSLNLLLKNNPDKKKINIGVASLTNLWLSKKMLDKDLQKRLIIHGQNFNNSEFIFTNHFYGINPKSDNKFNIPKNYKKFSELRKGKILISEFYIKK